MRPAWQILWRFLMISGKYESKELKELWRIKEEAYKEVAGGKDIVEMIRRRISICRGSALRFRKRIKAAPRSRKREMGCARKG